MKTKDLIGPALDWAVCVAEGNSPVINPFRFGATRFGIFDSPLGYTIKRYSTDWAQGGPIIEREKIALTPCNSQWEAIVDGHLGVSPTPLIAAMRCFVVSRLGDEVTVPEELL